MALFKPDLLRSFAVGFALGAAALVATMGDAAAPQGAVIAAANAAPVVIDQTR